jgi:antitoxin YefM
MEAVAYSTFRNNLKSYMEKTRDNAETLLVTSNDPSNNVVVMNARDYESLMETVRIYENPYLHEKILRGMQQVREGRMTEHELLDD